MISIFHLLVIIAVIGVPAVVAFKLRAKGPNRFGDTPAKVGFYQAVRLFFVKALELKSRSSRSEYWYSGLFIIIIPLVIEFGGLSIGFNEETIEGMSGLFGLFCLIPNITITVRRLHDVNRTGWLFPIFLFPIIGQAILLGLMLQRPVDQD